MEKIPKKRGPKGPSKYKKDFHPKDFIRLSKQGKTLMQIALEWDLSRQTIFTWSKTHKEFSYAVKKGAHYSEAWYANLGYLAMLDQATVNGKKVKVNLGFYVWMTKNLFKWSDKLDQRVAGSQQTDVKYTIAIPSNGREAKKS